jgi:hypothetical protein
MFAVMAHAHIRTSSTVTRLGASTRRSKERARLRPAKDPLAPALLGTKSHQFIGAVLAAGVREPLTSEIGRLAALATGDEPSLTYRQSIRARLRSDTQLYLRRFVPSWGFVGYDVLAGGLRLDLVWRDGDGRIWADEVKTGRFTVLDKRVLSQVERQLVAGGERWGSDFAGVRVCLFGQSSSSLAITADGRELSGELFPEAGPGQSAGFRGAA